MYIVIIVIIVVEKRALRSLYVNSWEDDDSTVIAPAIWLFGLNIRVRSMCVCVLCHICVSCWPLLLLLLLLSAVGLLTFRNLVYLEYIRQLIEQGFMPVGHAYVGHIGACYVIAGNTFTCVIRTEPMLFDLRKKWENSVLIKCKYVINECSVFQEWFFNSQNTKWFLRICFSQKRRERDSWAKAYCSFRSF